MKRGCFVSLAGLFRKGGEKSVLYGDDVVIGRPVGLTRMIHISRDPTAPFGSEPSSSFTHRTEGLAHRLGEIPE